MKRQNKIMLPLITIVLAGQLQLQGQEDKHKAFEMGSISLNKTLISSSLDKRYGSHNDFLLLSPQHSYLSTLDAGYNWSSGSLTTIDMGVFGGGSSILLGLHPYSKKKQAYNYNREFRIGLSLNSKYLSNYGSIRTIIGDTTVNSNVYYRGNSSYIGLDASYLYKSDPERRFSFYVGYGMNAGISYFSNLTRSTSVDTSVKITVGGTTHTYWIGSYYNSSTNAFQLNPSYFVNVYIPYGVNYRLAKTKPILNNFSIFAEGRIGMEYTGYKNGNGFLSKSFNLTSGIRYNLVKKS